MKKIKKLFGAIIVLALMACSKDGGPNDPVANNAPGTFDLIGVPNGTTKVDVVPIFSWKPSVDPDGDTVTYDLLLDAQADPTTVLASNLTTTSYKVSEHLHLTTPYSWKVVASDGKGKSTASNTNNFTTRGLNLPKAPITTAAFPKGVAGHTSAVFQNKLWVIGGNSEGDYLNSVWYSEDGSDWSMSSMLSSFTPREKHSTAVFDNKLWVIGGYDGTYKNDVWYSGDGATWTRATASAKFSPRSGHSTIVFEDKLWVIGGNVLGSNTNDVWYSSDGFNWIEAIGTETFSARFGHTTTVFDNKLWLIGGYDGMIKNDVWYSNDGANWVQEIGANDFSPRYGHTAAVYDEKLWVIGGIAGPNFRIDLWFKSEGAEWVRLPEEGIFLKRVEYTTLVFNDKLWVIGGFDGMYLNDVWALD